MFAKLFTAASLAILATAKPAPQAVDACSTGALQCCQSTTNASDPAAADILNSIGVVVQDADALIGFGCSGVTGISVGGGTCNANAVCCQDNSYGEIVSLGCVPVTLRTG